MKRRDGENNSFWTITTSREEYSTQTGNTNSLHQRNSLRCWIRCGNYFELIIYKCIKTKWRSGFLLSNHLVLLIKENRLWIARPGSILYIVHVMPFEGIIHYFNNFIFSSWFIVSHSTVNHFQRLFPNKPFVNSFYFSNLETRYSLPHLQ